ncbi:hypothetical protein Taro_043925 [Colocasia esculenta]|uniref:Receptor kinase-like protein Xa21 n=1 Tax=Colocasia esculenta TaxID=4460 RepID=A0A843X1P1_COLES|nr:hypothetical protein [Colocasia esculenta]
MKMEYCQRRALCRAISSLPFLPTFLVWSYLVCSSVSSSSWPAVSFLTHRPPPQLQENSADHLALLTFRSSLASDPLGALSSWNDSFHFCRWRGVECGGLPAERVVGLHLSSLGLIGSIHTSVTNLTFLRTLDLSNNTFQGHIPEELCLELLHLRLLNLTMNSLEGEIPDSLGRCSEAEYISFRQNSLFGAIPPSLSNLSSLQALDLSRNRLTGGIPPQLGSVTTLMKLSLGDNYLSGSIPPSLGNLTKLGTLSFTRNSLSGTIPPTIRDLDSLTRFAVETNGLSGTFPASILYNLSSLLVLGLGGNQFSGTLPPNIGALFPNLQILSLSNNRFYGPIPSSIANASSLRVIQMSFNAFSGVVPSTLGNMGNLTSLALADNRLEADNKDDWSFLTSLGNCTHLKQLAVHGNRLGGVLPEAVSNLSKVLGKLALQDNLISGNIPQGIGDLVGLTVLALGNNLINGTIPQTIGMLRNLGILFLSNNRLSGQIPSSIFNLTRLNHLSVQINQLKGALSPSFGNLKSLQEVYLSVNKFSGTIPKELLSISSVTLLVLSDNISLSGVLPTEIHQLKSINLLDVSKNKLSGEIPSTIWATVRAWYTLTCMIPQSFNKLRGLETLDISSNNLSGNIPGFLQEFRYLNHLNISYNNFDGEAPKGGIFQNASAVSVLGNPKLCGGILQFHLPLCSRGESRRSHGHVLLTLTIITIPGVIICTIIAIICIVFSRCSKRRASPSMVQSNELLPRVTYSELFKATEGFSPCNLIGAGSFGSVYKGEMDLAGHDSKFVAVKVINLQQHGASKSFMKECEALKNIRHRNLIKIFTSCSSIDFSGHDFKALVFEFMQNGSLEQWLHPVENENCDIKSLSLGQRINIAVDVASAISYLHCHSTRPTVHRDLKPSNILLDGYMTAHVSDFGLARFLPTKDDSRNPTSSLVFAGSIGYVAPEYGMGCNASIEGDVYSYGILLLEIITGRRPTDVLFVDDLTLHKFVQMAIPDHVSDIVDPYLLRESTENVYGNSLSMANMIEEARVTCLVSMARLGLRCSMDSPKERMQMEDVAKEMTTIKERFLGAMIHGS